MIRKNSAPPGYKPRTAHQVASCYTDCAVPVAKILKEIFNEYKMYNYYLLFEFNVRFYLIRMFLNFNEVIFKDFVALLMTLKTDQLGYKSLSYGSCTTSEYKAEIGYYFLNL